MHARALWRDHRIRNPTFWLEVSFYHRRRRRGRLNGRKRYDRRERGFIISGITEENGGGVARVVTKSKIPWKRVGGRMCQVSLTERYQSSLFLFSALVSSQISPPLRLLSSPPHSTRYYYCYYRHRLFFFHYHRRLRVLRTVRFTRVRSNRNGSFRSPSVL